jgi:HD-GYP domain-containing protein (c-di-GMP phosphodiesterase class II)
MTAAEERLLADASSRRSSRPNHRDVIAHTARSGTFVVAVAVLIIALGDGRTPAIGQAAALTLSLALLSRIEFNVGSGFTDPTQIVLVAMLFVVPPVWVPVLVAIAMTLGQVPDVVVGRLYPSRLLTGPGHAWHAVGPALVFALADVGAPQLADIPIYVLAIAAQFLLDYAVSALSERISLGVAPTLQLRVMRPIWLADLLLSPIGVLAAIATYREPYAFLLVLPFAVLLASFAREHRARIAQAIELSSAYRNTALLLGDVIGEDDAYTGAHSQSVVTVAAGIGHELKLDDDELRLVELGALLHDVGKIAIPKHIINKPGPLDDHEWDVVRTHTIVGQQMLDRVGGALADVGVVVRSSHERYDGTGYPDGACGADIPLASRIVGVADAYSAMTTDRPYRDALPEDEAIRRLLAGSGSQFDPAVVDAMVVVLIRQSRPRALAPPQITALA